MEECIEELFLSTIKINNSDSLHKGQEEESFLSGRRIEESDHVEHTR